MFEGLFDVFSRRRAGGGPRKRLTATFRSRVLMLCDDQFSSSGQGYRAADYDHEFWAEIHRRLEYLVGQPRLSQVRAPSVRQDAIAFLTGCPDDNFLDFIEYTFQVESYWRVVSDENAMVDVINQFFSLDDLPYAVTRFVREAQTRPFHGGIPGEVSVLVSSPRVILREQEATYVEAIEPAMHLLVDKRFTSANVEYLDALTDYRKARYSDCLTKCGSAFESTIKIICERKRWPYQPTDTAAPLLKTIFAHAGLDAYFEQPLMIVATLRNRLGSAHGAGTQDKTVSPHRARFALNATAAGILLLVEECL
jgi:Abortive infection C-terminus